MCGFAGFFDPNINLKESECRNIAVVRRMQRRLLRGMGMRSFAYVTDHSAVSYSEPGIDNKISFYSDGDVYVILMTANVGKKDYTNAEQIYHMYSRNGKTLPDGMECSCIGMIIDEACKAMRLFNVGFCNASLYYMLLNGRIVFATEMKGLLEYPGTQAVLSLDGIQSLFEIGKLPKYSTVFDGIFSLPPFCNAVYTTEKFSLAERDCSSSENAFYDEKTFENLSRYGNASCIKIAEKRVLSSLLEIAIERDRPTYSAQDDVWFFSLCRQNGMPYGRDAFQPLSRAPCTLLRHEVYRKIRMREHQSVCNNTRSFPVSAEERSYSAQGLAFGLLLQTKLKAIMRDKSQPLHRLISPEAVYKCLAMPERSERSLFFILQLCLWINHYRVFIKV